MTNYSTKGVLPICLVTVLREDCQYAQLRYKRWAADMPSYGTEEGLPICPVTVQTEGCRYAQLG
jgi:hypothetical protein